MYGICQVCHIVSDKSARIPLGTVVAWVSVQGNGITPPFCKLRDYNFKKQSLTEVKCGIKTIEMTKKIIRMFVNTKENAYLCIRKQNRMSNPKKQSNYE